MQELPAEGRYRVVFLASPTVYWQRRSLNATGWAGGRRHVGPSVRTTEHELTGRCTERLGLACARLSHVNSPRFARVALIAAMPGHGLADARDMNMGA